MDNCKTISIRFNMENESDEMLYLKLAEGAHGTSIAAHAKSLLAKLSEYEAAHSSNDEFLKCVLSAIREEMQDQGMRLVGALLSGLNGRNVPAAYENEDQEGTLPEECEGLPEDFSDVLDFMK